MSEASGMWGPADTAFATAFTITGSSGELVDDSTADAADLPDLVGIDDPFESQLRDFLLVARGEIDAADARVTADDGVAAVRIARAAIESIETGHPVRLEVDRPDD